MSDSFYNTINLEARELSDAQQKALTQEQRILRFAIQFHGQNSSFAPSAIAKAIFEGEGVPITSVRRAMTSLTKRGDLVKSAIMIVGPYGKPEHVWFVSAKWSRAAPVQRELL